MTGIGDRFDFPLRFEPIFRRYIWGGRRLAEVLGKPIGPESDYAESWEIVDRPDDQSRVAHGPWAGRTLGDLLNTAGESILGKPIWDAVRSPRIPAQFRGRFPLLIKFLDARERLSVQVHPNDRQAALLQPPDLGKTEAWYVLDAAPGSKIYAGLRRPSTPQEIRHALETNQVEQHLNAVEARPGQCVLIEAGTIHAVGAGILLLEIQQSSDTTFRLFDWNRIGVHGEARPLHVDQALAVANLTRGPVQPVTSPKPRHFRVPLVRCDKFWIDRWQGTGNYALETQDAFLVLVVVAGRVELAAGGQRESLAIGSTALIPSACRDTTLRAPRDATWLTVGVPTPASSAA